MGALPDGWTLDRVRDLAPGALLVSCERRVTIPTMTTDAAPEGVHVLRPDIILYWPDDRGSGYCLVREIDDEEWCMGVMRADGSVYCWATYGTDLGRAIRAL